MKILILYMNLIALLYAHSIPPSSSEICPPGTQRINSRCEPVIQNELIPAHSSQELSRPRRETDPGYCRLNAECKYYEICLNTACRDTGTCNYNIDCAPDLICYDHLCMDQRGVMDSCYTDENCGSFRRCENMTCVDGARHEKVDCEQSKDCAGSMICYNWECHDIRAQMENCYTDDSCPHYKICVNLSCVPGKKPIIVIDPPGK